jgi:hypothetical protein
MGKVVQPAFVGGQQALVLGQVDRVNPPKALLVDGAAGSGGLEAAPQVDVVAVGGASGRVEIDGVMDDRQDLRLAGVDVRNPPRAAALAHLDRRGLAVRVHAEVALGEQDDLLLFHVVGSPGGHGHHSAATGHFECLDLCLVDVGHGPLRTVAVDAVQLLGRGVD